MAEGKYERETNRFDCLGLDLNRPVDSVKPQKFPYLKNCRSYQAGRIEPRDGLTDIALVVAGQLDTHSCRRLNDPRTGGWTRIVGSGTHLAYGQTSFTDALGGWSGDPLALVPYRPDQSPESWMYVADRLLQRKINIGGAVHPIGLAPPATPPTAALTIPPQYKVVDEFDLNPPAPTWVAALTAGVPAAFNRTNTTITQILYDTAPTLTGWACVQPDSMDGIGVGERLHFNLGGGTDEIETVEQVHPGSVATTIGAIIYDSGTSGDCSLILATPIEQAEVDGLIHNTPINENARIRAVVRGPDGIVSLRLATTGTWAAANAVQILPSFRVYLGNTHAAGVGETIVTVAMTSLIGTGTGTLTRTIALDLSTIATGVPSRPEDYMHISLRVDHPELVTELKVQLDVDVVTPSFTQNYYWRSFRASDLTSAAQNLQPLVTTRAQVLQRDVIDSPIDQRINTGKELLPDSVTTPSSSDSATSQQMAVGQKQWSELLFRLSDLIRVGTDDSRSLLNVAAIRIVAIVTGAVTLDMDSWWIGGGYGPDVLQPTGDPYIYRYRARVPSTGATSNWSPAIRGGVSPHRQQVIVTPTQYPPPSGTTMATTDFVLDIQRFGGEIDVWHYVGTTANTNPASFNDVYPDDTVVTLPSEDQDHWQPWPVIAAPVSGTTGIVAGTTVNDGTAQFDLRWAPGTEIKVNGIPYTIYKVWGNTRLETVENMGSQTSVSWRVDEPTLQNQPFACLWGDEQLGAMFGCGDTINPGRLYFTNGNDPDSTRETNYIDITSPSEPLMNGVVYNLRSYVFSSERMFQILATGNPAAPWQAQEIPNGKGLFARWAITRTPAPIIAYLAKDGICITTGGESTTLTDADLYLLFPNEGNLGVAVNGVGAPNIVQAQAADLRLDWYDEYLYFDYATVGGGTTTLVFAFDLGATQPGGAPGGWFWDIYTPNVRFHYGEEGPSVHSLLVGGANGHLLQYGGLSDAGVPFSMELTTPFRDQGDPRSNKLYGDIMLDTNTNGASVTATPYLNNGGTALPSVSVSTSNRQQIGIALGASWQTARNIAISLITSISTAARPFFYIWEPRWTFESAPISASSWEISPTTFGMENWKHMGLVRICHVSTTALSFTVTLDGVVQPTITIPASGGIYVQSVFRVPVWKAKLWKLRLASTAEFRLDGRDSFFQLKEWGSDGPYQAVRILGDFALVEG